MIDVQSNDKQTSSNNKCIHPLKHHIVTIAAVVCRKCGLELGKHLVNEPKRAYTSDEYKNRIHTEVVDTLYPYRTVISTRYSEIPLKLRRKYLRLAKYNKFSTTSHHRNLIKAIPMLHAFCNELHLPSYIYDTSRYLYLETVHRKYAMGKTLEFVVLSCIYVALRIHQVYRPLHDLKALEPKADIFTISERIIREILPAFNIEIQAYQFKHYLEYLCAKLNVYSIANQLAYFLRHYQRHAKFRLEGKNPLGFIGAACYYLLKENNEKITQKMIAEAACVTEVTIRSRYKQIQLYCAKHFPNGVPKKQRI